MRRFSPLFLVLSLLFGCDTILALHQERPYTKDTFHMAAAQAEGDEDGRPPENEPGVAPDITLSPTDDEEGPPPITVPFKPFECPHVYRQTVPPPGETEEWTESGLAIYWVNGEQISCYLPVKGEEAFWLAPGYH